MRRPIFGRKFYKRNVYAKINRTSGRTLFAALNGEFAVYV